MKRAHEQTPFSIRMNKRTMSRLDMEARRAGDPRSRTAERLIDEGLRMSDHAGILFRDGPAGRRAALVAGPDVWEVIETVRGSGLAGDAAVAATAEWGNLTPQQVRAAVRYYAEFGEEIDERIRLNREEAERERRAWERERDVLG